MIEKIKNSLELQLNIKYGFVCGFYWMLYCCTLSMASAFLMGRGFSTAGIGFLLALTFLIAIVLQQIISASVDNSTRFSVLDYIIALAVILLISLIFLVGASDSKFATAFWFLLIGLDLTIMLPLTNALNFSLEKTHIKMNFGVARSCGSLFFFVISLIIGKLMNDISVNAAPITAVIVCILFIVDLLWIKYDVRDYNILSSSDNDPLKDRENDSIFSVKAVKNIYFKYKSFFIFLLGVVGFYFGHVLINNFFYQIVVNVGGDTADTGVILAIQAIVELPGMIFFEKLRDMFGTKRILEASAIFFFVKIFISTIATTVGGLYVSVFFQAVAFAVFIPASVHLVDDIMSKEDAVKGQAFVTIAMTLANFLAAIIGGIIINAAGATSALVFGCIVTLVGVVVAIFGLVKINYN